MCFLRLQEILEVAEDMAIDIPHMWLYLAELITPMLHEGGIPMGELFRLVPLCPFLSVFKWVNLMSNPWWPFLSAGRFQSLWSPWDKLESCWSTSSLYSAKEWWESSIILYLHCIISHSVFFWPFRFWVYFWKLNFKLDLLIFYSSHTEQMLKFESFHLAVRNVVWYMNVSVYKQCVSLSHQSHKKAGTMWREAGLRWKDFLPEDVDVNKFVTEEVRGHSLASSSSSMKIFS